MLNKPDVFGYICDLGANVEGASQGPITLQKSKILQPLGLHWLKLLECKSKKRQLNAMDDIASVCKKLALQVMHKAREGHPFLVIGGDHTSAIGTWSGAAAGLKDPLGLIWIDAHLDAHTPKTSHSQNIHGMPLAVLLGYGDHKLTRLENDQVALQPDNLTVIGTRSFEEEEAHFLKMLKVKVYDMNEVKKRGLHSVMQEAVHHIEQNTKQFGVSIDLDAIDPNDAPGVSVPEPDGLNFKELLESLHFISKSPHFMGAEIAEFNPNNDIDHLTEKVVGDLIQTLFKC